MESPRSSNQGPPPENASALISEVLNQLRTLELAYKDLSRRIQDLEDASWRQRRKLKELAR